MTMNITERQKEIIESSGHYVIEFKLWCKKLSTVIKDVRSAMMIWMSEFAEKVIYPALKIITDKINDIFDFIGDYIKNPKSNYIWQKPKLKICKKIVNNYRLYIKRCTIYHCRNNC